MKVYVSGPMSGLPDYNRPAFHAAAQQLRDRGYDVVNPAEHELDSDATWTDYMKQDIRLLLDCDGIHMLPCWDDSRGATLELMIARALGMREVSL